MMIRLSSSEMEYGCPCAICSESDDIPNVQWSNPFPGRPMTAAQESHSTTIAASERNIIMIRNSGKVIGVSTSIRSG